MSTEVATRRDDRKVTIEEARIVFRNFAGKEGQYNREGDRNFSVLLDEDIANQMITDGWNVKWLKAREEGDVPQAHLPVSVSYKQRPPRVVMITSKGRVNLDESLVEMLDFVDIRNVDLIINPYEWAVNAKTGIKAYLHAIYIIIEEDELERKYSDVPELDASAGRAALTTGHEEEIWEGEVVE